VITAAVLALLPDIPVFGMGRGVTTETEWAEISLIQESKMLDLGLVAIKRQQERNEQFCSSVLITRQ